MRGFVLAASSPRKRAWLRALAMVSIAAAALAMQWAGALPRPLAELENLLKDRLIAWNASNQAEDRLVVVDIDEASLTAIGPWPWPRSTIAELMERLLSDHRVRGVGLDIVFPAPADAPGDQRLAALAESAPLALAQVFDFALRERPIETGVPVLQPLPPQASELRQWAAPATGYIANHAGLAHARCVGNIGILPDSDGQIRKVPLAAHLQEGYSLLLPLAMLQCDSSRAPGSLRSFHGLVKQPYWAVPYTRSWSAYTVIPAREVLQGRIDPQWLQDRWVLVGSSALGLNDRVATPLGESVPGVMVHAAVLTALLDKSAAHPAESWEHTGRALASVWIVLSLAVSGWVIGRWRAWALLPLSLVWLLGWLAIAAGLVHQQLDFSATSPILAQLALFALLPLEWWLTQRDQGQLLRTFANYVAPSVLRQMLQQGIEQPLVPRYCEITVLSADMQNYSGLTTMGNLEDAAQLTREFLQCLTGPLLQHQGTLDKYTGDGLVAFWGAPVPMPDHADRAVQAALQMVEQVRQWNLLRQQQGLPMARVRVGIESGKALVGDLGTSFRRTYTAVGDCINSASKLQNAAKQYNHDIIVGSEAARRITRHRLVAIGGIVLPGHTRSLTLYTPFHAGRSLPPAMQQLTNPKAGHSH